MCEKFKIKQNTIRRIKNNGVIKIIYRVTKFEPFLTILLITSGAKISKQIGAENFVSPERENTLNSLPGLNSDIFEMFLLSHEAIVGNHDENGIVSPKGIRKILLYLPIMSPFLSSKTETP